MEAPTWPVAAPHPPPLRTFVGSTWRCLGVARSPERLAVERCGHHLLLAPSGSILMWVPVCDKGQAGNRMVVPQKARCFYVSNCPSMLLSWVEG